MTGYQADPVSLRRSAAEVEAATDDLDAAIGDVGELLDAMATTYEQAEDAVRGSFDGIAGQL